MENLTSLSPTVLRNTFRANHLPPPADPSISQASQDSLSVVDVSASSESDTENEDETTPSFPTEAAAIAHAKKDGTLGFKGTHRGTTGAFTKYFYCGLREPKRRGHVRTGCLGQTKVVKRDPSLPLWTVEVVQRTQPTAIMQTKSTASPARSGTV